MIKKLFLVLGILCLSTTLTLSQKSDQTPLEKAQNKGKRKLLSKVDLQNPVFAVTTAPEKWKNESAVVLLAYRKTQRIIEKNSSPKGEAFRVYSLSRILLQDQFAVNDFSSFNLSNYELLEIKVIKPDGTTFLLDKSRAVKNEVRIEDLFAAGLYHVVSTTSKIPVPSLEAGDIIEIERYWENLYPSMGAVSRGSWGSTFEVLELTSRYPVYRTLFEFELQGTNRINWKSMNGAPDLVLVKTKKDMSYYRFEDSLRDRTKAEYWSPGTLSKPFVKFALCNYYGRHYKGDFAIKSTEPMREITQQQIIDLAVEIHRDKKNSHSGIFLEFIKKYPLNELDNEAFLNRFYEFFRANYYFKWARNLDAEMANIQFIMIMRRILEKRNIEFDYIAGIPKQLGKIGDAVSAKELVWGLRIRESGEVINLFNAYSMLGEVMYSLKGTEVYVVSPGRWKKHFSISTEKLPGAEAGQSRFIHAIKALIKPDFETLRIVQTNTMSGQARYSYLSDMPYQLFLADLTMLFGEEAIDYPSSQAFYQDMDEVEYEEESNRLDTMFLWTLNKMSREEMESMRRSPHFDIESYESIEVNQDGIHQETPDLVFTETLEVKGLIGRAGEYYVIDLGRLLGQQMELLDSEDSVRVQDIYFGTPRTIEYEVKLEIPPGMKVEGYQDFNVRVDNAAGSYVVSCELKDGLLVVHAVKTYKQEYLPHSDWYLVQEFIHAASEMNNKKIILKR